MASKSKVKKVAKKAAKKAAKPSVVGPGLAKVAMGAAGLVTGATGASAPRSSGGRRRRHGPTFWANKVLTEKLKKRYWRIKYGSR